MPPDPVRDRRRTFSTSQRAALYLAADGCCVECGAPLSPGWHADHHNPWSRGGATDTLNGDALCPPCNIKKGARSMVELRTWQRYATDAFYARPEHRRDFLVCATPGAGKTTFALNLAKDLLLQGVIERVVVIVPTDALRQQWADNAAPFDLALKPVDGVEDYDKRDYQGCVATYGQLLGVGADAVRRVTRRPTLAIIDEIHHAGDNRAWGDSLQRALEHAEVRLALTGTPWRRKADSPIPFVRYSEPANGERPEVIVDYAYEYGAAVADDVCRRIEFHAYDGEARWTDPARSRKTTKGGEKTLSVEFTANLGADMAEEDVSAALDTVYSPQYRWMPSILAEANAMLDDLRTEVPDAAGLVVAERKWLADGYAKLLEDLTGERPPVVVSDPQTDPGGRAAKAAIDRFRDGRNKWIVAVKMISEGVDIPRLAIGVYASKTQTPLFFRQVVGRFVRVRPDEEFNARLVIPAVPELLRHAREIEEELRHQLELAQEEDQKAGGGGGGQRQGEMNFRTPVSASEPVFDRAILGGQECSPEEVARGAAECEASGIPMRFAVNMVTVLRRQDAAAAAAAPVQRPGTPASAPPARHRLEKNLRGDIKALVGKFARIANREYQEVNTALLRAGHPPRAKASLEELEATRQTLLRWLSEL